MYIESTDFAKVTAVHAKDFWYNIDQGTFRFIRHEQIPTLVADEYRQVEVYEFEYRQPGRRTFDSRPSVRMQLRGNAIEAVQFAGGQL